VDRKNKASSPTSSNGTEAAAPPFGEGDLGRLQQILLGDHARQAAERIDLLEQAMLGAVADMRRDVDLRFEELSNRLDAENSERTEEVGRLKGRATRESNARNEMSVEMHQKISHLESRLAEHLAALKDSQVDRTNLVDILTKAAASLASNDAD